MSSSPTSLPTFPGCPSYGFTSRPTYTVRVVERDGGYERRDRKSAEPRHVFDGMPMGDRPEQDIIAIAEFFHAMGGCTERFRFKDWADFKSCRVSDEPTGGDQPFVLTTGSPGGYQLVKLYSAAGRQTIRTIRHPVGDTISVRNNLGVDQPSSRWLIDEDTGLLQLLGGFVGTPGSWGGEFYVPCRFAADIAIELTNYRIMNLTCSLIELRPEDT